jgi:glycosyltransferase 2 family protein
MIISTVAAAAAYLAAALWAGRSEVAGALQLVPIGTLIGMLSLSALNYALRFLRWHYYLRTLGSSIPWRDNLRIYIGGFALTTTPGKAGEMARSIWLRPYGVPATVSLAAFMTERLQDLLAILLLSSLGLSWYGGAKWAVLTSLGLIAVAALVLQMPKIPALGALLRGEGRIASLGRRLAEILILARACLTPTRLLLGFLLGAAAWGAEAFGFSWLLRSLGHPLNLPVSVSIYALSMLAGALSFMPGGLGGSEAAMVLLLRMLRVPLSAAVAATLLIRLATLWFAVLLGIIALLWRSTASASAARAIRPDSV